MISKEQKEKWNSEYSSLFHINKKLSEDSYSVVVSLPKEIKGKLFDTVAIFRGSLESPSFFAPLKSFEVDGKTTVWFVSKPTDHEKSYLSFRYGEDCGISVTLPVEFN